MKKEPKPKKAKGKAPEGEVNVYNSERQFVRTEDAEGNTVSAAST